MTTSKGDYLPIGPSEYKIYFIDQNNKKRRRIEEPRPHIKQKQKQILKELEELISFPAFVSARKESSVVVNASFHKEAKYVFKFDIKNFYKTIRKELVRAELSTLLTAEHIDRILNISFLHYYESYPLLATGSPLSPFISNVSLLSFDYALNSYLSTMSYNYSRYIDDITISSAKEFNRVEYKNIKLWIIDALAERHLSLNNRKTELIFPNRNAAFQVTGVRLNGSSPVPRKLLEKVRILLHQQQFKDTPIAEKLNGYLGHIKALDEDKYYSLLSKYKISEELLHGKLISSSTSIE